MTLPIYLTIVRDMNRDHIAQVRRFNRLVTLRAGALDDHFLGRDRPLGESRVLWEIGSQGRDLRELRTVLGLDSGYLSRLAQSLAGKGLITLQEDQDDERVRRAAVTPEGAAEIDLMNRRAEEAAEALLGGLTRSQQERLVAAMAEVESLLRAAATRIERVDPAGWQARWCVERYFAELAERFTEGFDPVQSIPADHAELRPPRGAFLLATIDGEKSACGAVKLLPDGSASIKRMWVAPEARGLGLGRRILGALEDDARGLGASIARLETNRALLEAIQLYRSAGYTEVPPFNDDPYANHWFEKHLT